MKKAFVLSLALMLTFAPAVSLQAQPTVVSQSQVKKAIALKLDPTAVLDKAMNLSRVIVKQSIVFKDGRTLEVYYKRNNNVVEVYSPDSPKNYELDDAKLIKSSKFEIVDQVQGKLYRKSTVKKLRNIFSSLAKRYL